MRAGPRRRWARGARAAVATGLVAGWLLAVPVAASAQSLEGCSGSATSKDADGASIDSATAANGKITDGAGDESFSKSNPFEVDNDGVVDYSGRTDAVITDHHWTVSIMGIEVASGGSANSQGTQESTDTFDIGDNLPVKITGLVKVKGEVKGTGGSCSGEGYVKLKGNALASPVTWVGLVLAGLGGVGVFLSLPKAKPGVAA